MSTIALLFLVFFSAPVLGQWLNISNGKYVLGADLAIGGYFGHFAKIGGLSTINIHDAGRGIQMSFYAGPAAYDNCTWQNTTWPWNPIEGGDAFGHFSQVLNSSLNAGGDGGSLLSRPLQWACDSIPCECEFEKQFSFVADLPAVLITATLHNHRSDHQQYQPRNQELPAIYVPGSMCELSCYRGDKPFSNEPLSVWRNASSQPWAPGHIECSEGSVFWTDPLSGLTLGLFRPKLQTLFLAGFFGEMCVGGALDDSTGYVASVETVALPWNSTFSYQFVLLMGDSVQQARQLVYKLHSVNLSSLN